MIYPRCVEIVSLSKRKYFDIDKGSLFLITCRKNSDLKYAQSILEMNGYSSWFNAYHCSGTFDDEIFFVQNMLVEDADITVRDDIIKGFRFYYQHWEDEN